MSGRSLLSAIMPAMLLILAAEPDLAHGWQDGGASEVGISIDEDPAGQPVIAYQGEYKALKLARPLTALGLPAGAGNCGPEALFLLWFCDTIDP